MVFGIISKSVKKRRRGYLLIKRIMQIIGHVAYIGVLTAGTIDRCITAKRTLNYVANIGILLPTLFRAAIAARRAKDFLCILPMKHISHPPC